MSCQVAFPPEIPFECLASLVSSLRTGAVSLETIQTGMWCAGCLTSYLAGNKNTVGAEMGLENLSEVSNEDLIARLDNFVQTHQMPAHLPAASEEGNVTAPNYSIPSWLLPILLQLLQRWMVG